MFHGKQIKLSYDRSTVVTNLNNNEKIDTNFVGVPKAPYGFSRNARGRFGPPAFDDMAFDVGEGTKKMEIRLE